MVIQKWRISQSKIFRQNPTGMGFRGVCTQGGSDPEWKAEIYF